MKKKKRGRPRYFDKAKYKRRTVVERTFAWEDKFRRVLVVIAAHGLAPNDYAIQLVHDALDMNALFA